jgi:hypothetical protein
MITSRPSATLVRELRQRNRNPHYMVAHLRVQWTVISKWTKRRLGASRRVLCLVRILLGFWLVDCWLVGWLVGLSIGLLVGRPVGRLVGSSVGRSFGRFYQSVGCLFCRSVARSVGWSVGRSVGWSVGHSFGRSVAQRVAGLPRTWLRLCHEKRRFQFS